MTHDIDPTLAARLERSKAHIAKLDCDQELKDALVARMTQLARDASILGPISDTPWTNRVYVYNPDGDPTPFEP